MFAIQKFYRSPKAIYYILEVFINPIRFDLPNYSRQRESLLSERASESKLPCVIELAFLPNEKNYLHEKNVVPIRMACTVQPVKRKLDYETMSYKKEI